MSDFLSIADVAALLEKSPSRVYGLIGQGLLPSVRVGGRIYVPRAAWNRWVDKQSQDALAGMNREMADAH